MQYSEVIKSISHNQHEILYNIIQLHNNGKPFDCDPTYSIGNFYGRFNINTDDDKSVEIEIPSPQYKFDVYPQLDDVIKIEPLGNLPLEDNSIGSICIDLPFVISCGPSMNNPTGDKTNIISKRFSAYYPVAELLRSYKHWINESYRVLRQDGILCFKTQPTITGSKMLNTPYYSRLIAESIGFDSLDEFILIAKNRLISGKVNKQQHARSFHSYFLVFKKSLKKKIRYFDFMEDDELEEVLNGLKKYNIK